MPLLTLIYLCSSLDKSNLGNAKSLGMMKDLGSDPTGDTYALLNSLYYVSYAPFSQYHNKARKHNKANTLQWYLSLCSENVHVWFRCSPCALSSGVSPLPALPVYRTMQAHSRADSSSDLEVNFLLLLTSILLAFDGNR
jgi:hypothetical protein